MDAGAGPRRRARGADGRSARVYGHDDGGGLLPVLAAGLFSGVFVFFTVYWDPTLYLVDVVYVTTLLVVWFFDGMQLFAFGVADATVQVALVATFLYLFAREYGQRPTGADR